MLQESTVLLVTCLCNHQKVMDFKIRLGSENPAGHSSLSLYCPWHPFNCQQTEIILGKELIFYSLFLFFISLFFISLFLFPLICSNVLQGTRTAYGLPALAYRFEKMDVSSLNPEFQMNHVSIKLFLCFRTHFLQLSHPLAAVKAESSASGWCEEKRVTTIFPVILEKPNCC
ncbi:hypothetical protein EK904_000608 [Melospiza melodia maxima]|nr:hypothetical protein EK904_000608 [Melospiza melodia maxima]